MKRARWESENPDRFEQSKAERKTDKVKKDRDYLVDRRKNLKTRYNMSLDDYDSLLKAQDYRCKLCNKEHMTNNKRLYVDHCHRTGKVRGLLCSNCNLSLGQIGDTIESVEKILKYLKGEL